MSPISRIVVATAVFAAAFAGVATAQDVSQRPAYGTVNLTSGFTPDPNIVQVQSGGNVNAETLNSGRHTGDCKGMIANAPDVRLNYTKGSLPLIISVASSADTTLVINAPDGSWFCDDDGGVNGNNPAIRFNSPQSGQYDIWIGTYANASLQNAQLHISELTSQ